MAKLTSPGVSVTIHDISTHAPIRDESVWQETLEWERHWRGGPIHHPMMDIEYRLRMVERKLTGPRTDDLEKYPALKEAWEEYKLVEKLITNENR